MSLAAAPPEKWIREVYFDLTTPETLAFQPCSAQGKHLAGG